MYKLSLNICQPKEDLFVEHCFTIELENGIIPDAHGQIYTNLSDTECNPNNSYLNQGPCRSSIILKENKDYALDDFLKVFEGGVLYLWPTVSISDELKKILENIK